MSVRSGGELRKAAVLGLVLLGLAACGEVSEEDTDTGNGCPDLVAPQGVVHVGANVNSATTWTATNVYVVDVPIQVSATLTIAPGTVVKFAPSTSLQVTAGGAIVAAGTCARIVFTSLLDDASGGDTNGDGAATSPAPGDWGYLSVGATGSTFRSCDFLYGGGAMPAAGTLVVTGGVAATVTHSLFAHCQGGTPADTRAAALNLSAAGAGTIVSNNFFYDVDVPLVVNRAFDVDGTNTFGGEGGAPLSNTYDGIFFDGLYSLASAVTWSETEVPYVIVQPLGIPAGSTLTLADGVIVKFATGQRIDVSGALVANGARFTSLRDDAAGGDTNGDGAATAAAPGDWRGLNVQASGSAFDRCTFTYGGSSAPQWGTLAVGSAGAPPVVTITGSTFADNAGGTLTDVRAAALNLGGAGGASVVTGNTFYGNVVPMVINGRVSVDGSNVFHLTDLAGTVSNTYDGIFLDGTQRTVDGPATWSNTEVPYMVLNSTAMTIADTGTLTLAAGVVVKLDRVRIDLVGALSPATGTGATFTSFKDDTRLGDSNGDGSATTPATGDWVGINDCADGSCTAAAWDNILFADFPLLP